MPQLWKNHRTLGFEVGRISDPNAPGRELVTLHTGPSPYDYQVALAHALMPVGPNEILFRLRVAVAGAIEQAAFLGASPADIASAITAEMPVQRRAKGKRRWPISY